jgi:hypothetical protein
MSSDKRKHPRVSKLLEAKWSGASGGSPCRIADISWGGCFVQTVAMPAIGEAAALTVKVGDREVTLTGSIVYREPSIGFAVRFDPLTGEQIDVLRELLGDPPLDAA